MQKKSMNAQALPFSDKVALASSTFDTVYKCQ